MHDAFNCVSIIEGLPLSIECIATSNSKLLVGTSQGHLLVYSIIENRNARGNEQKFEMDLERSNKAFGKKPILQLNVIELYGILISLSDGMINIHDYINYTAKSQFPKQKGVLFYSLDQSKLLTESTLRLVTISRRKVQSYIWEKDKFQELYSELALPDTPKTAVFIGDFICLAMKRDYMLINARTGNIISLFDTGKKQEPLIFPMPSGELALCRDEVTLFLSVSKSGEHHQKHAVTWSDVPYDMQFSNPFIIAALPRHIEICSRNPKLLVQKIDVSGARKIVQNPFCYASSTSHVWRLDPIPIDHQIEQLIKTKEFEMALTLTELMDNPDLKKKKVLQIKTLFGFELFCKKKFDESLQMFKDIEKDPTYVIGLFPNLLPQNFCKQLDYPAKPPNLTQGDLEIGFKVLTEYLTQIRNKNQSVQGGEMEESKRMLLQIVDTSLLKCYLQTKENMIAPLLRLKNYCHVEECERVLAKAKKANELILLYQSTGKHEKALDLLLRQADLPNSPLKGTDKTIEYLQKLGPNNIQLILEYSVWVLKSDPEKSLKIFTNDTPETEALPRDKVTAHLETHAPKCVIRYLEHIIFDWKESSSEFHNKLVLFYKESILPLYREYLLELPEGEPRKKAGKEPGELGKLRTRLLFFLDSSSHYQPCKLLRYFPQNALFEERALLLGRDGRHEEALALYIYVLKDTQMAEQYCRKQYELSKDENHNVYVSLIKMYLQPQNLTFLLPQSLVGDYEPEANIPAALKVMNNHYQKIDVAQVLDFLPSTIEIKDINNFLTNVFKDKMQQRRNSQILKNLLQAEHLQVQEQRIFYQRNNKCVITEERACRACHKRIGTSAFARYPNGVIVHYYCCKDRNNCPPEWL